MKKNLLILSIIFTTVLYNHCFSQNNGECGTNSNMVYSTDPSRGGNCSNSGTAWITKYRTPQYWIPNNSTPIKTILVNIVVCQDDNGNNSFDWQDTPTFKADVDLMFVNINNIYSNPQPKGYALTCEPTINNITDTRIRFELNEIIFIKNTTFNQTCSFPGGETIDAYVRANFPNSRKAMNHIFTNSTSPGCGWLGYYNWYNGNGYVLTKQIWSGAYKNNPDYIGHICHEYGHALGLNHTYDSEVTQISYFDFLDDVFGTCQEPSMSNPLNPCFANCGQQGAPCAYTPAAGNVAYLQKCFFSGSSGNPLMCGMTGPSNINNYISPKSAGRMHRALSLVNNVFMGPDDRPMHQYVKEKYSYSVPLEITSNEIWDFTMQLYQDIVVKTGYVLTIACEIRMPINGRIIVEPGAKLIIDGGVITCAWDNAIWQGIEVWGDRTKTQTPANQGYLIMKNGALIENARLGVTLSKEGERYWFNGGVIQATNSTFKNNRKCIAFASYHRPFGTDINLSYINNCDFVCDAPMQDPAFIDSYGRPLGTRDFVSLWDVSHILFKGNTFINSGTFDPDIRGRAIYSEDASYSIIPLVTSSTIDKNEFVNLTEGVYPVTLLGSALKNVTITNSVFTNVYHGITGNIKFSSISGNTFNNIPTGQIGLDAWGIYMDGAKGFSISGNNVFNSTGSNNYGVIVKYSGSFGGIVSDNTFNGLEFANQTELNNPLLNISCNTYNNNQNAWSINPVTTSSTFANQGTGCSNSQTRAGDQFSGNTCDIKSYLTSNWQYYGWGNPGSTIPQCVTGNVGLNNCNKLFSDPTTCVQLPPCGSLPCAMALEIAMLKEKGISERLNMLSELIRFHSSNADDQKIISLLNKENTLESKKILIPTHIDKKDLVKAQNLLNQIPSDNAENINYKKYYQQLIDLETAGKTVHQINSSQELIIRDVVASNTEVSANAQAMLEFVRGEQTIRIPEKEIINRMAQQLNTTELLAKEEQAFLSDNFPNPYADFTTITATIPSKTQQSSIEITNLIGVKVNTYKLQPGENTLNIKKEDIGKGIYFYSLIIEGKIIVTKRMVTIE